MSSQEERKVELRVSDVMSTNLVTAKPSETIVDVAKKMAENDVGSVIIVDEKGTLLGIITEKDIVTRVVARGLDPRNTYAEEIMTRNPITVYEDATLAAAAEYMYEKKIGHLPVINSEGRLVGIVARSDIIRIAPSLIEILFLKEAETSS